MKLLIAIAVLGLAAFYFPPPTEAPAGFDNKSNGMVDDATHQADQGKFEEVEAIADGLGPLYNAQFSISRRISTSQAWNALRSIAPRMSSPNSRLNRLSMSSSSMSSSAILMFLSAALPEL